MTDWNSTETIMNNNDQLTQDFTLPFDQKLARLGELTTLITLISPLPAFISCHKRSSEKNAMLAKISFNFLLAMWMTNVIWLAYSIKIENIDILVINAIGTLIASIFVTIFLYVKFKVARFTTHLSRLILGILFTIAVSSSLTDKWSNGLVATLCSMTQYVFILDGVKGILRTKDPEKTNLPLAIACIFNSIVWGYYAYLVADVFIMIPNVAALFAGISQICLYLWTMRSISDKSLPIKVLHRCFLKQKKILPSNKKDEFEIEEEVSFTTRYNPADTDSLVSIERD